MLRTKIRRYTCAVLAVCMAAIPLGAGSLFADEQQIALTLDQAITRALSSHPSIVQADASAAVARARLRQRQSAYLPTITVQGSYTHLSPDPIIDFPGLGQVMFFAEDNYDAHVALHQIIYDFGRTGNGVDAARNGWLAARDSAQLARSGIAFQTIQAFYAVLLLQDSINVQNEQLKTLDEFMRITRNKVASGVATDFDVLTTQVKVEEANNKKIDLENSLTKQMITLRRLLGLPDGTVISLEGTMSPDLTEFDETAFIADAVQYRLELRIARASEAAARSALKSTRSDHLPQLSVAATYGTKNGYMPRLGEMTENNSGTAIFELPIFNGLRSYQQGKESAANLTAAQSRTRDTADAVIADVHQTASDVRAGLAKMKSAELHVQLAQKAVDQAKVRYASGVITNLDLLNIETALDEAQLLRLQAIYGYIISREALLKAAGIESYASLLR